MDHKPLFIKSFIHSYIQYYHPFMRSSFHFPVKRQLFLICCVQV